MNTPTYPTSGLPTYNIKNNPSIFNFKLNTISKVNQLRQYLLAISFNQTFLMTVLDYRNMGRSYYNQIPKKYCATVKLNKVEGFDNKQITVYLPEPGGSLANSIKYTTYNNNTRVPLMKLMQPQRLPTLWSQILESDPNYPGYNWYQAKQIGTFTKDAPTALTPNEQVIYYYIKNADFFTRVLKLLLSSFYDHAVRRFQCYTLVFPSDFYSGNKDQRTFTVTGDFLRSVYSDYLRASRLPSPFKLPAPVTVNPTYNIPTTNYSQLNINKIVTADLQTTGVTGEKLTELNKVIEEPSDTFPI
jgi:hypothetical protein